MNDEAYADDMSGARAPEAEQHEDVGPQDNPYDFDAQEAASPNPQEIRGIKWRGRSYVLKRATADAVVRFTNARMRCARITHEDDSPVRTVTPVGGGELPYLLVSMCLFLVRTNTQDGTEQQIPLNVEALRGPKGFPYHIIEKLYEDAKRISYIDQAKDPHKRLAELNRERSKILKQLGRAGENGNGSGGGSGTDHQGLVEISAGAGVGGAGDEDVVGNS